MRERLLFLLLMLVLVLAVPLSYWLLFEHGMSVDEEDNASTAGSPKISAGIEPTIPPPAPPVTALSLTESYGSVEIAREGGSWEPAELGVVLGMHDRIRTDAKGRAILERPGAFIVELDSSSEFEVQSLSDTLSRLLLQQGMVSAEVVEDRNRAIEIQASKTVARSRGGAFRLAVDRQGLVTAGSSRGELEINASGRVVVVRPGYFTRVAEGGAPADPIKVPPNLFLKVHWPKESRLASRHLLVSGSTETGARVKINGELVLVDSRGRFKKAVVLSEGGNRVRIDAYDVAGRKKQSVSNEILVDTRPDSFEIRTSPDMWKKKKE